MQSKAYKAANAAFTVAFTKFDAVRKEYRAGKIGDAEFIAARREYQKAQAYFDAAFSAEAQS